jgi:multimeric flavodoxin WrbA
MKLLIVNGAPKGEESITLQTSLYLSVLLPEHEFEPIHVGKNPLRWERRPEEIASRISRADCVIFSYPVYTFLIPSQLMRFIEAMKACGGDFRDKYVTQISTSKHFYDMTAHRFVRENVQDMGMRYVEGLSADMEDLLTEKGRDEAVKFFDYLLFNMKYGISETSVPAALPSHRPVKVPVCGKEKPGRVVIVADLAKEDRALSDMIGRFRAVFPYATDLVNLREFHFSGGCLGCFRCAADGVCVYKDGFSDMLRDRIQTADAIVTAFPIRDHGMGSLFKTYDDRQFCNGHRTVTRGKPMAALVSGNYPAEENLQTVLEARAETGGNF